MKPVVHKDQIILVSENYDAKKTHSTFIPHFGVWLTLIVILLAVLLASLLWFFKEVAIQETSSKAVNTQTLHSQPEPSPNPPQIEPTKTDSEASPQPRSILEQEKMQELQVIRKLVQEHSEHLEQATQATPPKVIKPLAKTPEEPSSTEKHNTDSSDTITSKTSTTSSKTSPKLESQVVTKSTPSVAAEVVHTRPERSTQSIHTEETFKNPPTETPKPPSQNYEILEQSLGIPLIQE